MSDQSKVSIVKFTIKSTIKSISLMSSFTLGGYVSFWEQRTLPPTHYAFYCIMKENEYVLCKFVTFKIYTNIVTWVGCSETYWVWATQNLGCVKPIWTWNQTPENASDEALTISAQSSRVCWSVVRSVVWGLEISTALKSSLIPNHSWAANISDKDSWHKQTDKHTHTL